MNTVSLLARWDCWFSIGEMESDKYDVWRLVLHDACLSASPFAIKPPLQLDLVWFEDLPF